ncbi:MAG: sulfite exporter TauE/SafE family protein [Cytophagales bacterium]
MLTFLSGIALGLAGILHCAGMCSPLAFIVKTRLNMPNGISFYHLGRATSYLSLGVIGSSIGFVGEWTNQLHLFSIASGILLTTSILIPSTLSIKSSQFITKFFPREKGTLSTYFFGIANGLLPCGLVYAALAATIALGNFLDSTLFMMGFAISTIFSLSISSLIINKIPFKIKKSFVLLIVGSILIVRGLGLGIPYLSPSIPKEKNNQVNEHKFCG